MLKSCFTLLLSVAVLTQTFAQKTKKIDSLQILPDITVVGRASTNDYQQLPEVVGTQIYAGKKNALVILDNVQGNVVTNNMRQVLSKVAGVHIWESDPSGTQIGIAARGLSANRSWEFNTRQNGYDIAADPYGYPEAYYNPQLQAVQRIEIVRGQGSLQYGPQFGGMVNYIIRNGSEINKPVEFESHQTIGSNGLFNTYNAIGGKTAKWHYYSFFDHKNGNGYRQNSQFFTNSYYGTVTHYFTPKISLTAELMYSQVRSQQPGGLSEAMYQSGNIQQSLRSRNWFNIVWTTPALILNYAITDKIKWNTKVFATLGDRSSVGFVGGNRTMLVKDTVNASTMQYNARTPQVDYYRNYAIESKIISQYKLGKINNVFSAGVRAYTGNTHRLSDGEGTTGSDYDMSLTKAYKKDINFTTNNVALFAENLIKIGNLSVIPGVRFEYLEGKANGRDGYNSTNQPLLLKDITKSRNFTLFGIGAEYHLNNGTELYTSIAQAYRPIQFSNLQTPAATLDSIDKNLSDSKGFNADFGYRGKLSNIAQFDLSVYYVKYDNRIGSLPLPIGNLTTNVGGSISKGIETFVDVNLARALKLPTYTDVNVYSTYGYIDATYNGDNKDVNKGKKVENAPQHIWRGGLAVGYKNIRLTTQLSYVSQCYSDAANTVTASADGNKGLIPAYTVADVTLSAKINKNISIKSGINNVANATYFTRRAGGYPGPGILPADGRTFFATVVFKL